MDRAAVRSAPRARDPRSIAALIGPDPRVIADEIWAKLMWAGLNLTRDDLPKHANRREPARRGIRSSSSARSRCCGCSPGCASTRSSACASARSAGKHPTADAGDDGGCACSTSRPTRPRRVHQAGRPARRRRDRRVAGRPARAAQVPGPQDRRAGRHAVRLPRRAARQQVHQPGAGPAAVPQGRRPARGRPRRDHQPSRPGDDRDAALQRQGPDVAVRAAGLARTLITAARPSTTRGSRRSP